MILFNFFFKTNTFGRAYSHGAAKSRCRAMHGGVAGVAMWQSTAALADDMARLPRRGSWRGEARLNRCAVGSLPLSVCPTGVEAARGACVAASQLPCAWLLPFPPLSPPSYLPPSSSSALVKVMMLLLVVLTMDSRIRIGS
jgi:hypothetical protein